jgi:hypothetical protein
LAKYFGKIRQFFNITKWKKKERRTLVNNDWDAILFGVCWV